MWLQLHFEDFLPRSLRHTGHTFIPLPGLIVAASASPAVAPVAPTSVLVILLLLSPLLLLLLPLLLLLLTLLLTLACVFAKPPFVAPILFEIVVYLLAQHLRVGCASLLCGFRAT